MEFKKIEWAIMTGQYSNGKNAFMGKIKVGSVSWNGIDKDENLRYIAHCALPSITNIPSRSKYPTEELAMSRVKDLVEVWLKEIVK